MRLHPLTLPKHGLPSEVWLSIEENYQHNSLSHQNGLVLPRSAGSSFYQDAVLEYATLRYELGAGVQFSVMQALQSSTAVHEDRQVLVFAEYYLSGFRGRKQ